MAERARFLSKDLFYKITFLNCDSPVCFHRLFPIGTDNTFPVVIEVGVRLAPNGDYRATVQIKAPKSPPVSRLISSRRFQTLRGSRSNYADSPRPFDPRERHDLILEVTEEEEEEEVLTFMCKVQFPYVLPYICTV